MLVALPDALLCDISQSLMEGSSLTEHHKDLTAGAGGGEEQQQAQGQTHPLDTSEMRAWLGKVLLAIRPAAPFVTVNFVF